MHGTVCGNACRIRWWQYDQSSANSSHLESRLIFQKLDCEVTQQVAFHSWQLMVSGGLGYVGNQLSETGPSLLSNTRYRFDGVGITGGLQAIRPSQRLSGFAFQGSLQWTGAYGNSTGPAFAVISGESQRSYPSTVASILELSLGPRWERKLSGGAIVSVGGAAEAQYWATGLGAFNASVLDFSAGAGDIGLVGLTLNAGIRR